MRLFRSLLLAFGVGGILGAPGAAEAQTGKDFFGGKTVTYIVATDPGGGYDTYGRLVAEFMQKHLPGSTFIVRNMPGAGNLIGANFINASPPDGLTIGTFNTGLIYSQVAGKDGVRFDLGKMSWIGKAAADTRVMVVSADSGIESFKQLQELKQPVKFATAGPGTASMIELTILKELLDLPVDVITGYQGKEDQMAMRRGEVVGTLSSFSAFDPFVREGRGRFIAQVGGPKSDLPQLSTLVASATAQRAIALVESQGTIGRLTAGPPGIPADRLQALRDAYAASIADPDFLAKAKRLDLPIDALIGDDLAAAVRKALDQPPEVVELLRAALK